MIVAGTISRFLTRIGAALAFAALVFALTQVGYGQTIESRLKDRLTETRRASDDIVVVAIDDASIQALGVWPWPRSLHANMIDALTEDGARVIGYDVTFSEASTAAEDQALERAIRESGRVVLAFESDLSPLDAFVAAAKRTGDTSVITDADGVVRRMVIHESFANSVSGDALQTSDVYLQIPFVGPPHSFRTVSFSDVLNGTIPPQTFNDKTVLVGATAPDLHDAYLTPTSEGALMPGVEIHANAIQAMREGRVLSELKPTHIAILLFLFALLLGACSLMRLRYHLISAIGILVGYLVVALAVSSTGLLLPILPPIAVIVGATVVDVAIRYFAEKRERAWIHRAFAHYLAPQVIEKLVRGETKLELGGVKKQLTILFSDIRGFTSLSEKMKPEELVPFLNEYLTAMTDVVLETEGVVDKYIGDAIMAFWGAPLPQSDHANRAARTAIEMKRRLRELQETWRAQGKPDIAIGIGVNTGEVIVGNMGSKQRFDYTVMGDDVNLASRLEGLTKHYGVTILISEATRNLLDDSVRVRPIDLVAVKGKKDAVRVFEIDPPEFAAEFESALKHYYAREWKQALAVFEKLETDARDKPSAIFAERCRALIAHPPEAGWDGVYRATEK